MHRAGEQAKQLPEESMALSAQNLPFQDKQFDLAQ